LGPWRHYQGCWPCPASSRGSPNPCPWPSTPFQLNPRLSVPAPATLETFLCGEGDDPLTGWLHGCSSLVGADMTISTSNRRTAVISIKVGLSV